MGRDHDHDDARDHAPGKIPATGHDHAEDAAKGHAGHGHGHNQVPADFGRAFAIGIVLNLGFVIIEAIMAGSPTRWPCSRTLATTSATC